MQFTLFALGFLIFSQVCFAESSILFSQKEKKLAEQALAQVEIELNTFEGLDFHSKKAIDTILKKAVRNLRLKGSWRLALHIEKDWGRFQQGAGKSIGDFEPFHKWLSDTYEKVEADLGYAHCYSQRISDLKTINHGLKVIFNPCPYGYVEFFKHFASDDPKYRSFLPVVSYWTTVLGCYAGTYGTGTLMVCGAAGLMVESMVDEQLAPYLAPQIYENKCSVEL
jgi:hypothetical protein